MADRASAPSSSATLPRSPVMLELTPGSSAHHRTRPRPITTTTNASGSAAATASTADVSVRASSAAAQPALAASSRANQSSQQQLNRPAETITSPTAALLHQYDEQIQQEEQVHDTRGAILAGVAHLDSPTLADHHSAHSEQKDSQQRQYRITTTTAGTISSANPPRRRHQHTSFDSSDSPPHEIGEEYARIRASQLHQRSFDSSDPQLPSSQPSQSPPQQQRVLDTPLDQLEVLDEETEHHLRVIDDLERRRNSQSNITTPGPFLRNESLQSILTASSTTSGGADLTPERLTRDLHERQSIMEAPMNSNQPFMVSSRHLDTSVDPLHLAAGDAGRRLVVHHHLHHSSKDHAHPTATSTADSNLRLDANGKLTQQAPPSLPHSTSVSRITVESDLDDSPHHSHSRPGSGTPSGANSKIGSGSESDGKPDLSRRISRGRGYRVTDPWYRKVYQTVRAFRPGYALWLIPPDHPVRKFLQLIVQSKPFQLLIIVTIIFNLILLALFHVVDSWSKPAEYIFTCLFLIEFVLKILASGVFMDKKSYFRSPWNILDFVILVPSTVALFLGGNTKPAAVVRVFRVLRPVARLTQLDGLQRLRLSLTKSFHPLMTALGLLGLFFLLFSLISVSVFQGKLSWVCTHDFTNATTTQHCGSSSVTCPTNYSCVDQGVSGNPFGGLQSFDNIPVALVTLFCITTLDKWSELMYITMDSTHWSSCFFFIFVVVANAFFVMNLAFAIIRSGFEKLVVESDLKKQQAQREKEIKEEQYQERERLRLRRNRKRPPGTPEEPPEPRPREWYRLPMFQLPWFEQNIRRHVAWVGNHPWFDGLFFAITAINIVLLASEYDGEPTTYFNFLYVANNMLTALFTIEFIIKWITLGMIYYWIESPLNLLDFTVVIVGLLELGLSGSGSLDVIRIVRVFRLFRIIRVLKVVGRLEGLSRLVAVVAGSMHDIGFTGLFLALFLLLYACIGMYIFGDSYYQVGMIGGTPPRLNFQDFIHSTFLCFHLLTLDNWTKILYNGIASTNWLAAIYFISWIVLGVYVLLNIFVAIIVTSFEIEQQKITKVKIDRLKRKKLFLLYRKSFGYGGGTGGTGGEEDESAKDTGRKGGILTTGNKRTFNPFVKKGGMMVVGGKGQPSLLAASQAAAAGTPDTDGEDALAGIKLGHHHHRKHGARSRTPTTNRTRRLTESSSTESGGALTRGNSKSVLSSVWGGNSAPTESEPNSSSAPVDLKRTTSLPVPAAATATASKSNYVVPSVFTAPIGTNDSLAHKRKMIAMQQHLETTTGTTSSKKLSPTQPTKGKESSAPLPSEKYQDANRASPQITLASPSGVMSPSSTTALMQTPSRTQPTIARLIATSNLRPRPPPGPKPSASPISLQIFTSPNGSSAIYNKPSTASYGWGESSLASPSNVLTSPVSSNWKPPPLIRLGSKPRKSSKTSSRQSPNVTAATDPNQVKPLFPFKLTTAQQRYFRTGENEAPEYDEDSENDSSSSSSNDSRSEDADSEGEDASNIALQFTDHPKSPAKLKRLNSKHLVLHLPPSSQSPDASPHHSRTPTMTSQPPTSLPHSRNNSLVPPTTVPIAIHARTPSAEEERIIPIPHGVSPAVLAFIQRTRASIPLLPPTSHETGGAGAPGLSSKPPSLSAQRSLSPHTLLGEVPSQSNLSRVSSSSSATSPPPSPGLGSFTFSKKSAFHAASHSHSLSNKSSNSPNISPNTGTTRSYHDTISSTTVVTTPPATTFTTSGMRPPESPKFGAQQQPFPPPPPPSPPRVPAPPLKPFNSARDLLTAPPNGSGSISPESIHTPPHLIHGSSSSDLGINGPIDSSSTLVVTQPHRLSLFGPHSPNTPTRQLPHLTRPNSSASLLTVTEGPSRRGILKSHSPHGSGAATPTLPTPNRIATPNRQSPQLPLETISPGLAGGTTPGASFSKPPTIRASSKTVLFADQHSASSSNLNLVSNTNASSEPASGRASISKPMEDDQREPIFSPSQTRDRELSLLAKGASSSNLGGGTTLMSPAEEDEGTAGVIDEEPSEEESSSSSDDDKPAWQIELEKEIAEDEAHSREALQPKPPPTTLRRVLSLRALVPWQEPRRPVSYVPYNYYKGHYLASHEWFRILSHGVFHKNFEYFITFFVLLSSASLTLENHTLDQAHGLGHTLWLMDRVILGVFIIEMFLKMLCMGVWGMDDAYLAINWNQLDFVIVITNIFNVSLDAGQWNALRALRVLRPLRLINKSGGMRAVVLTITRCFFPMFNVVFLLFLAYLTFGILGVRFWGNKMNLCQIDLDQQDRAAALGYTNAHVATFDQAPCEANFNGTTSWTTPRKNFDNILNALITLYSISTMQNWADLCFATMDATSATTAPSVDHTPVYAFYFVAFIFLVPWILNGLFVGVVFDTFIGLRDESSGLGLLSQTQKLWVQSQMKLLRARTQVVPSVPYHSRLRAFCHHLIFHIRFEVFIRTCVVLNVIIMGISYRGEPSVLTDFREGANVFFFVIYFTEMMAKLIALYPRLYFRDTWNRFDCLIVWMSFIEVILNYGTSGSSTKNLIMILKLFRIFRLFRVIKGLNRVQVLLRSLYLSLPKIANVGFLLLFIFFVFGIVGVELFGKIETGKCIGGNVGFKNFPLSMLTLFRVSTGQDWDCIMFDCMDTSQGGTPLALFFFFFFLLGVTFICLSLFIAVLLDNLSAALHHAAVAAARAERRRLMLTFQKQQQLLELDHARAELKLKQSILEEKALRRLKRREEQEEKQRKKAAKELEWVRNGGIMPDSSTAAATVDAHSPAPAPLHINADLADATPHPADGEFSPLQSPTAAELPRHPHHLATIGITKSQRHILREMERAEYKKVLAATRARQKARAKKDARKNAGVKIKSDRELLSALQLSEGEPAFMETLIGEYVEVWQSLDPNETRFVPVVKLPEILRRLDTPLGVGPQGSLYKMIVRCAGVTLRKHRFPPNKKFVRCVHFTELLHGLLHYLFGAEVPEGLTHVTSEIHQEVEKRIGVNVDEVMERDPLSTAGVWLACQAMGELWAAKQRRHASSITTTPAARTRRLDRS